MTNRLAGETSPYLLQHAENPVDWYPWGEEALNRAAQEDKPVLLSVGYSACHWCHVMEQESFENPEIARIMNENFISIKVDREERPDLDEIYMTAVQAINGSGGWPLTVFLTPDKRPFYGGTYFPPEDRKGMPGFPRVLQSVAHAYRNRKGEIESAAGQITTHLKRSLEVPSVVEPLTTDISGKAYIALKSTFDSENGGFGSAPKFPQPMALEFLLRYHHRTGDKDALEFVERTLEKMSRGGIYDQIGGGFHRYSVDARWLVPHFEKMLYDNAQLSRLYLHAYQATGKREYRLVVEETLDYVLREMRDRDGGFYSTQDADSEGIEGKYYTWTLDEIRELFGADEAKLAARYFGVTGSGNFERTNILNRMVEVESPAQEFGLTSEKLEARIAELKIKLLKRREKRIPPHRDGKILTDWNGLMLASLAEAATVLDRKDYMEAAISNATFLSEALCNGEILKHSYKDGQAKINGYLLDYALLCRGLLSLYEATFEDRWFRIAGDIADTMVQQFWDEAKGIFYDTGNNQEQLIVRPRNVHDNALPSGSGAASGVLIRLARLTGNRDYERIAAINIRSIQGLMVRYPLAFGHWLGALDFYLSEPLEIVVAGQNGDLEMKLLLDVINRRYLPNKIVAGNSSEVQPHTPTVALLRGKVMVENRPTVYVCKDSVCQSPVTEPDDLAALLDSM